MNLITEGRRLVTIRKINNIEAIEGADLIVKATVDGWDVVQMFVLQLQCYHSDCIITCGCEMNNDTLYFSFKYTKNC